MSEPKVSESLLITLDGKYQTRDGRKVRILAIDKDSPVPVVGRISCDRGGETLYEWYADGRASSYGPTSYDLVPVPTEHHSWMVISLSGSPWSNRIYPAKELADLAANVFLGDRVIPITWFD